MDADLTCAPCKGKGVIRCEYEACLLDTHRCNDCGGTGRRLPRLSEWDALVVERDRLLEDYNNEARARSVEWREAHVQERISGYRRRAHKAEAERDRLRFIAKVADLTTRHPTKESLEDLRAALDRETP